MNLIEFALHT